MLKEIIRKNHFDKMGRYIGRKKLSSYLTKDELKFLENFSNELSEKEKIFLFLNDLKEEVAFCKCGNKKPFYGFVDGYPMFCKLTCPYSIEYRSKKAKKALLKKYGVDNPSHLPQTKKSHWSKNKDKKEKVKQKLKETYKSKTFEELKNIKNKRTQTNKERFGVENIFKNSEFIQQKFKEKYNVKNPMQVKEIFEKQQESGFKTKEIEFNGKIFKVRGYESKAFDYFEKEDEIENNFQIPFRDKIYYADFFIKNKNKIIEVKSSYTLKADIEKNISKMNWAKINGKDFEFWILDNERIILKEENEIFKFAFNKNFINQYNIFEFFEEKKDAFIILNFLKRHFKEDFLIDTIYKNEIKKDIKYYELEKILKLLYNKLLSFKTGDIQIYNIFYKFIKSFSKWSLNKNERIIVEETPKPKYQRRKWKRYYQLKKELKDLKSKKRKVKKKYFGSVLENKLNNINNEIFEKQKRLKELAEKLK